MAGAINITMQLEGAAELAKALEGLSEKMDRKIIRDALKEAAQPILHAARSKVPVLTGALAASITVKTGKRRGNLYARIQTGQGFFKGDTFYGAFIEFGHLAGPRRFGFGRHMVPAQPFMRPAYDENRAEALGIFMDVVRQGVDI